MSPVQMSDGLESYRQPCETCEGWGWVRSPSCNHSGCACPCGAVRCPECSGRGTVPIECSWCDDPATRRVGSELFCDDCNQPREDGPLGGMGYSISYSEELAAARRLK